MEHLYIIQGSKGLFKAGCTKDFKTRLMVLSRVFKERDNEVVRHQCFAPLRSAHVAELSLLSLLAGRFKRSHGWEWFLDVDFDAAVLMAEEGTAVGLHYDHPPTERGSHKAWVEEYRLKTVEKFGGPEAHAAWLANRRFSRYHIAVLRESGKRSFSSIAAVLQSAQVA